MDQEATEIIQEQLGSELNQGEEDLLLAWGRTESWTQDLHQLCEHKQTVSKGKTSATA